MTDSAPLNLGGRRVLVTGGSGFIGSHLVRRLLETGAEVGVLGRRLGPLAPLAGAVRFIKADLENADAVSAGVRSFSPQVVFHLASRPDGKESYEHSIASVKTNLMGTINLLEAHCRVGDGLFVLGDSTKSYGNVAVPYQGSSRELPNSSYAISKSASWHFTRLYSQLHGFPAVCVRPTLIFGPGQGFNLISYVLQCVDAGQKKIVLDGGDQTRDPLFIDDAVSAYLAAARPRLNGEVVVIGGGREYSVADLARRIVEIAGGSVEVVCEPVRARPTEIWRSWCDNTEAAALTGWSPRTSLEAGLEQTIEWLRGETADSLPDLG